MAAYATGVALSGVAVDTEVDKYLQEIAEGYELAARLDKDLTKSLAESSRCGSVAESAVEQYRRQVNNVSKALNHFSNCGSVAESIKAASKKKSKKKKTKINKNKDRCRPSGGIT